MLCYEISINGERVCTAGAENMRAMQIFLIRMASGTEAHAFVRGDSVESETHRESFTWLDRELRSEDEVRIRLVESNSPDQPKRIESFGTKTDETGAKTLYCSFCGQNQEQVEKIVAGYQGNICSECFKLTAEIFNEKA